MSEDGYLLTSHDGFVWDLLKSILKEASKAPSQDPLDEITRLAESGIELLKECAL